MMPKTVTTTDASGGATYSSPVIPNFLAKDFKIGGTCLVTGTANVDIQTTMDDLMTLGDSGVTWFSDPNYSGKTATFDFNYNYPVRALKIKQNSGSGSTSTTFIQGGPY